MPFGCLGLPSDFGCSAWNCLLWLFWLCRAASLPLPGAADAGSGTYPRFGHSRCRQTLFSFCSVRGLSEGVRNCSQGGWKHVVQLRWLLWLGPGYTVSPAQVICTAVCSGAAGNTAHPHWPCATNPVVNLERLS